MSPGFATTQWSMVLAARDGSDTEARTALESLCTAYWYPLYAYVRGLGNDPDTARDLTQAFFAEILEKNILQAVDRSKGRFRSFLLAAFKNYLSHERQRAAALKRGGGTRTISMDAREAEDRFRHEPVDQLTPEQIFERRWGLTIMERAMGRLEAETAATLERTVQFERLKPYLTGSEPHISYKDVAAELGTTAGAVKTAVHRMRQSYGRFLRQEVAETIADPAELDTELRHLLEVIRPWQAPPP